MSLINYSPIIWLNRPYFDLGLFNKSPLHVHGIEFSYRNLISGCPENHSENVTYPVSIVHPISLRESLIRETGLIQYKVETPLQLPSEFRTDRWNKLCEYLIHYQDLNAKVKLQVVNLLTSLCLHKSVLEYVPEISKTEIASNIALAGLASCRAMSQRMLQTNGDTRDILKKFEKVANHAPLRSKVRFSSAINLVGLYAKSFRDLKSAEFWRSAATQELSCLKNILDDFSHKLLTSIYYRAVVFVPILQQDRKAVIREMDWCESLAQSLMCEYNSEIEKIAARENLITVFESRTKEALWLGEIDLAESRANQLVDMEPLYSRYRLQLGEILIKLGKIEQAAQMYRSAARLGPPGTPIAWFMAGQCHEKLGELELACDCYLASVQMDELAISAVQRLNKLAPHLDNLALKSWSTERLQQLKEQQSNMESYTESSYIPEASSELKSSGKLVMV
jgi:tetratricopeptide (TPR) repeat protein